MVPVFDRSHILSFGEDPDEIGLVVETAVIADFRCAERRICQQFTSFCYSEVVYIGDEGYAGLSLEEMTECRIRHIYKSGSIRQSDLVRDVLFNVPAYLADTS